MKLWEITGQMLELQNMIEDGADPEIIKDTLESVEYDFEIKAQDIAKLVRNIRAEAEAFANEGKRMINKGTSLEEQANRLVKYLENEMMVTGKEKFKTQYFSFNIQNNPAKLVIDKPELIPMEYLIPQEPKADTKAIKELLKDMDDEKTEFAHLERGKSLRIR